MATSFAHWPRAEFPRHRSFEGTNNVHLWYAPLDLAPDACARLAQFLSTDEIERAERFVFERHRRRYTVGRGVLRLLLSSYVAGAPDQHVFSYGRRGKPMLQESQAAGLHFNVAHSHERILVGITTIGPLGVDLEHRRRFLYMEEIVQRTFSADEAATFRALQPDERVDAFYRGWTCKEAFIKVSGAGLAIPLDTFDVTLSPHEEARITRVGNKGDSTSRWTLLHFRPSPEYDAAVCVDGQATRVDARSLEGIDISDALGIKQF